MCVRMAGGVGCVFGAGGRRAFEGDSDAAAMLMRTGPQKSAQSEVCGSVRTELTDVFL